MTRDSTAPPPVEPAELEEFHPVRFPPAGESDVGKAAVVSPNFEPRPEPPGVTSKAAEQQAQPSTDSQVLATLPSQGEIDSTQLDPDAVKVVLRLKQHGHQAYLVGGCVRDLLLGNKPKDFDVATSAHPGEVRA